MFPKNGTWISVQHNKEFREKACKPTILPQFDICLSGIVSIIRIWWPTRYNVLVYLFVPNQLYMFRTIFCPSSGAFDCIYSFWYSPPMLVRKHRPKHIEFFGYKLINKK